MALDNQTFANLERDADDTGKFVNTKQVITPRYGNPFKSAPLVSEEMEIKADEVVAKGFYLGFANEAAMRAYTPSFAETRAKLDDTKKVYRWQRTSAEGVTPITGIWHDTGLSELDQAKVYASQEIKTNVAEKLEHLNSTNLFKWNDKNSIPVMFIDSSGKLWLKNVSSDIASQLLKIDLASYLTETILLNDDTNLFKFKDSNNIPVFTIKSSGDLSIQKIGVLQDILQVNNGADLFNYKDANGLSIFRIKHNGEVVLPKIGSLTNYIEERVESVSMQYRDAVYSAAKDTDNALCFNLENFEKQQITLTAEQVHAAAVFPHAVTKLRIPAITRIQKNKYLCFFEAREVDDDFGKNSQGVCTLTVDMQTFEVVVSDLKSLHSAEPKIGTAGYYTFMNACAVKLESGRIICIYVKRFGTNEHYLYKRYSDDDGLNWSDYEDIGTQLNMSFYNLLCPCSQGMVKQFGANKGRIIFPVWYSGKAYRASEFRAGYIYSDDAGETWRDGAFVQELAQGNEVQCCEDVSGDIIFNIRLEGVMMGGGSTDPNTYLNSFVSLKNGTIDHFTIINAPKLTDNSVMAGLMQGRNKFDGRSAKIQFVVAKKLRREKLTVYTSYDCCKSWNEYNLPDTNGYEGIAAYSCIESLSIDKNLILWEADNSNHIATSIISLKNLIGA